MSNSLVYFIQAGEFVKIGITTNIEARLRHFATHTPYEVNLLHTLPGGYCTEQCIHEHLAQFRVRGEWFRDGPEIRDYIDSGCPNATMPEIDGVVVKSYEPRYKGRYPLPSDAELPEWFLSLLRERDMDLIDLYDASSIHPDTVYRWLIASNDNLAVSGKIAPPLGLSYRELRDMRDRKSSHHHGYASGAG